MHADHVEHCRDSSRRASSRADDWFAYLRDIEPPIDEVNFWRPGEASFRMLQPGKPVLFRVKAPYNALFDMDYVTVSPDHRFLVSRRIKEELENGRDDYALHGSSIRLPQTPAHRPEPNALVWHNERR